MPKIKSGSRNRAQAERPDCPGVFSARSLDQAIPRLPANDTRILGGIPAINARLQPARIKYRVRGAEYARTRASFRTASPPVRNVSFANSFPAARRGFGARRGTALALDPFQSARSLWVYPPCVSAKNSLKDTRRCRKASAAMRLALRQCQARAPNGRRAAPQPISDRRSRRRDRCCCRGGHRYNGVSGRPQ